MLKYMTKGEFKKAIDERRFVVQNVSGNKFEAFYISDGGQNAEGATQFGLIRVVNPDTKTGYFTQTGGGYSKAMATIEDIAHYVDTNKEVEHEEGFEDFSCYSYFVSHQNYNEI